MNIKNMVYDKDAEINSNLDVYKFEKDINEYIYENFTEIYADDVVMESIGDRLASVKNKLVNTIKNLIAKFKKWMQKIIYNLSVHFASGKKLADKYNKQIQAAYKQYASKVKLNSVMVVGDTETKFKIWDIIMDCMDLVDNNTNKMTITPITVSTDEGQIQIVDKSGRLNTVELNKFVDKCHFGDNVAKPRPISEIISAKGILVGLSESKNAIKKAKDSIKWYEKWAKDETAKVNNATESQFNSPEEFNNWVANQKLNIKLGGQSGVYFNKTTVALYKKINKISIAASKALLKKAGYMSADDVNSRGNASDETADKTKTNASDETADNGNKTKTQTKTKTQNKTKTQTKTKTQNKAKSIFNRIKNKKR